MAHYDVMSLETKFIGRINLILLCLCCIHKKTIFHYILRYYIPVCVGGQGVSLRATIHPIFFPTRALLPSYHRSSLSSHHSSTSDRPTDRCFDKVSDSAFTKRQADRPTDRRNAFLDRLVDQIRHRPTDRPTVSLVVSWLDGFSVGRSVGRCLCPSRLEAFHGLNRFRRAATDRPTEIGRRGGRRERSKKKTVDRRSVGASVRSSERMNTHSLGMCAILSVFFSIFDHSEQGRKEKEGGRNGEGGKGRKEAGDSKEMERPGD